MIRPILLASLVAGAALSLPSARAQSFLDIAGLSPYTRYQQFETEHFRLVYAEGYFAFAERAATHLENVHRILSPILKWQPRGRIDVLVADNEDAANGFASPSLRVGMVLIATPPESWSSTSYADDWIKLLVFHEYTHVLNIDPTTEWMEALRILFGDIIRPNNLWPSWMIEGLAVYYETRLSGRGRGRSPYYEGVLRAFVQDHKLDRKNGDNFLTLDRINGDFPGFPGGEIPYLFGYEMWEQMARNYPARPDAESAMGEISLCSSARVPFFINGNQQNVTGRTWYDLWDQFVSETYARLEPQIAQMKSVGVTPFEPVTDADYSSLGGAVSPDGKWLAYTKASTRRRTGLYLRDLASGREIRIADKVMGVGLAFTPDSRRLIYSTIVRTHTYQAYSDLFAYSIDGGGITRLSEGLRLKDPTISPDGKTLAFIKVQAGTHTLWTGELTEENGDLSLTRLRVVYRPADFTILGTPKFLDADHVVFSDQRVDHSQSDLRAIDLAANRTDTILADGYMNRSLAVRDGSIYFVSDRTGIDEIHRVSATPATGTPESPERLTRLVTGATLPFFGPDGKLWASVLTSIGYQIGRLNTVAPIATNPDVQPHAPEPMTEALATPAPLSLTAADARNYTPWSSLAPRQWAPVAYIDYSSIGGLELGGSFLGFDTTGKHQYFGLLGYQFKTHQFEPFVSYTYYGFRPSVTLSAARDTFDYGLDGYPYYRKQSDVTVAFSFPMRWTFTSLVPSLYLSREWNGIYDIGSGDRVGTVDPDYNRDRISVIGGALRFASTERSRYGFMTERGDEFTLAGEGRQYDPDYALWKYLAMYQHYFPVGEHSVLTPRLRWLGSSRTEAGISRFFARAEGKATDNLSDRGTSSSLNRLGIRGYRMGSAFNYNRSTGVASLDYHFPIDRIFRGPGTWPLFLEQAHAFVFADAIYIQNNIIGAHVLPAYGGGVSLDTTLLLRAPIRFNLEMQNGTRRDLGGETNVFLTIESDGLF